MSKLINKTRLEQFATALWTKIKRRYDNALSGATLSDGTSQEKKITFTRVSGTEEVVNLKDYTRLQDRNEFKEDVSADNVAIIDNSGIGSGTSFASQNRSLGFRQLTTNSFVDGYIDHIRVYMESSIAVNTASTWRVWAIKKGATDKNGDVVNEVIYNQETFTVNSVTGDSAGDKFVKIPINKIFENDIYFIVQCTTHKLKVVSSIEQRYINDVVNMNQSQPPMQKGETIDWTNGYNATENTAIMYLYGRESIGSLSLKLKQTQADSSLYVKHSECTTEGGQETHAGKVVKLDRQGKLNKDMLPSIAIGEYFEIDAFTDDALRRLNHYENGDTVVVTSGADRGSRYFCINKDGSNLAHLTDAFIKLNDKNGLVTSVNEKTGAIVLGIASTTDKVQLKVNNEIKSEIDIISDAEINSIIASLS